MCYVAKMGDKSSVICEGSFQYGRFLLFQLNMSEVENASSHTQQVAPEHLLLWDTGIIESALLCMVLPV